MADALEGILRELNDLRRRTERLEVLETPSATASSLPWVNVKDYGATGDGVTDDTAAIQAAITAASAAGGGVVLLPPGTYSVSATLVLAAYVHMMLTDGAVVKPSADVNVVEMRPLARLSGGKIETSSVALFSKAAVFWDGQYHFSTQFPTWVDGVHFVAGTTAGGDGCGNGLHLQAKTAVDGQSYVCGVFVNNCYFQTFDRAIYLEADGTDPNWYVNANTFHGLDIQYCNYGIDDSMTGNVAANGNTFDGVQIQGGTNSVRAITADGSYNHFTGVTVWDWGAAADPISVEFTAASDYNFCVVYAEPAAVSDAGNCNQIHLVQGPQIGGTREDPFDSDNIRMGIISGTARLIFEDNSKVWEIDNSDGTMRWYRPGSVKMSLTSDGDLDVLRALDAGGDLTVGGDATIDKGLGVGGVAPTHVGEVLARYSSAPNDSEARMLMLATGSDGTLGALYFYVFAKPSAVGGSRYVRIEAGDDVSYRPIALQPTAGNVLIGSTTDDGTKLQVTGNINVTEAYLVDGTKVVGNRGAHVADADGTLADLTSKFNALLSRLEAHGLIADS